MREFAVPPLALTDASTWDRLEKRMRRERRIRFAGGRLGYAWAYLMPVAWIVAVVVFFQLLQRTSPIAAPTAIFVATGILPYIMFRQTITSMMRSPSANRYMIYFRPTSISEILFASALLELINFLIVSVVIFGTISLVFDVPVPDDPFKVALALLVTWFFAFGFGRFAAIAGRMSDSFQRALPIVLRPLFWISGIFYIAAELPAPAQAILWYSPLFHTIEYLREGFFLGFSSTISELYYPLSLGLGFLILSAILERYWRTTAPERGLL